MEERRRESKEEHRTLSSFFLEYRKEILLLRRRWLDLCMYGLCNWREKIGWIQRRLQGSGLLRIGASGKPGSFSSRLSSPAALGELHYTSFLIACPAAALFYHEASLHSYFLRPSATPSLFPCLSRAYLFHGFSFIVRKVFPLGSFVPKFFDWTDPWSLSFPNLYQLLCHPRK